MSHHYDASDMVEPDGGKKEEEAGRRKNQKHCGGKHMNH
jgi:hypothetical protein